MNAREMIPGRPFRFLYVVLCLWFVSRAAVWIMGEHETNSATAASIEKPRLIASARAPDLRAAWDQKKRFEVWPNSTPPRFARQLGPSVAPHREEQVLILAGVRSRFSAAAPPKEGIFDTPPDGGIVPLPPPETARTKLDRWSLSAWLLYRPDHDGAQLANAGQLGASQAGARLAYDLTPSAGYSLAIHGRVSAALQSSSQAEGATGITLRPARNIPIALSVERRFNIDAGGRNAFAAYVAGGLNPTPLLAGLELEGYAQGGIVGASRTDLFADGRFSISKPLFPAENATQITAGLAVSGGAQPSLSRLDIGPHLSTRFRLGHSNARLAVEWRERVTGNARPSSGPAFILATDF